MKRLYDALLEGIPLKWLRGFCVALLMIAALAICEVFGFSLVRWTNVGFGGQEVVEAHFTPDGLLRAFSRVSVTRCPSNVTYMPIHLPQPGAKLESVTIGDRSVPFFPSRDPAEKDKYYAMPSLPENALKAALVEVVWSLPVSEMTVRDDYRVFYLQGVIPVRSYAANVVIDEGAPYQFGGKYSSWKNYNMFWTKQPRYVEGQMGTCGIEIHATGNAEVGGQ